jgi:hypothetical protein
MNKKETKLWLDQYGYKYYASTRAELIKKVCPYTKYPKVSKMYQDKKDGTTVHVGYIVSYHWLTAYKRVEIPE